MKDYELASIIAEQAPRAGNDMLHLLKKDIRSYLEQEQNRNSQYFTLMGMPSIEGNSTRYVTIFHINSHAIDEIYDFLLENEEILNTIRGYYWNKDNNYIEIWYGKECFLFFNYSEGVVEIG